MDWQYISLLLGIIHASQEVDPWFGQEARKELNRIKAEATRPAAPVTVSDGPKSVPIFPEESTVKRRL